MYKLRCFCETFQKAKEMLMRPQGAFITGADFLIDGGATASLFYGPLQH